MNPPRELVRPRRRGGDRWFVAVLPGQSTPDRARLVASTLHLTAYDANRILRAASAQPFPFKGEDAAKDFEERLRACGVAFVRFHQSALDAVPDARLVEVADVPQGAGEPYRDAAMTLSTVDPPDGTRVAIGDLRLAVAGALVTKQFRDETKVISVSSHFDESGFRGHQHVHVEKRFEHEYDDRTIIDLYFHGMPPFRLVERYTRISGFGLLPFEHAVAFQRLRKWLESRVEVCAGNEREWLAESVGRDISSALADEVTTSDVATSSSAPAWDEWSARAWLIRTLARAGSESATGLGF